MAAEVAAMQFAGGLSIARVAELWDRDAEWVEDAVRSAFLEWIPKRAGGLKATRAEAKAARREAAKSAQQRQAVQSEIVFGCSLSEARAPERIAA
ncbi:MAG: hypothetical protein WB424_09820 [Terracidiphilus sp.]